MTTTLTAAEWSRIRAHAHQEQPRSMSDLHIAATTIAQDLRRAALVIGDVADWLPNPIDRANLLGTLATIHDAAALIDTLAGLEEE